MVVLGRNTALALMAAAGLLAGSMAPTSAAALPGKKGPVTAVYVEVNNNPQPREVGKYRLARTGGNAFDIAIIFAANIKADPGGNPILSFNQNLRSVLQDADTQIRPLQRRGIKVLLSVIGDHDGVGVSNLRSREEAAAFAKQLSDAVTEYGLDRIDFDDEWADYGKGEPVNDHSFPFLVSALRDHLPDKLITLYFYGPAKNKLKYGDIDLAEVFDYSWNPDYGTWAVPRINLPEDRLAPAAVNFTGTPVEDAAELARRTVDEGYGAFLTYNLPRSDSHRYASAFTRELYGSDTVYVGDNVPFAATPREETSHDMITGRG
ncbi:endo-beta-N-acetylglucosaminidase H [Actinosynnema sp. NPDC050801]|uniref:endo-beta-N-acetylglucosaminidase H n=1 Tax=unclassified Actinosynnema TaxID=2637065 RepID=UPI0033D71915